MNVITKGLANGELYPGPLYAINEGIASTIRLRKRRPSGSFVAVVIIYTIDTPQLLTTSIETGVQLYDDDIKLYGVYDKKLNTRFS